MTILVGLEVHKEVYFRSLSTPLFWGPPEPFGLDKVIHKAALAPQGRKEQ